MLSDSQVEIVTFLSWAVWLGLIGGGLAGVLAGALIRPIRTHHVLSFLPGMFLAAAPSAAAAVAASFAIAIFQMLLCRPGHKAGWDVPIWSVSIQAIVIFAVGIAGAVLAQRPRRITPSRRSIFISVLLGAVVGAVAALGTAFDGYFVLQSNARPIRQGITGFLVGGLAVVLWRVVVEVGYRRAKALQATAAAPGS
jgi:hypothetical protein